MADPTASALGPVVAAGVALAAAVVGWALGRARARVRLALQDRQRTRAEADGLRRAAETERAAEVREAEIAAREAALARRAQAEAELRAREEDLARRATVLVERETDAAARERELADLRERLAAREGPIKEREKQSAGLRKERKTALQAVRATLERLSGQPLPELQAALKDAELEEVRGRAAQALRAVEQSVNDPEHVRRAKRTMGIAVGRFSGHYLTERHLSNIPVSDPRTGKPPLGEGELGAIAEVSGITLTLNEAGDTVRLEGLDGVGREVARRSIARALKRGVRGDGIAKLAKDAAAEVDREVVELGRRAFHVLEIPRAHPDIVRLVGRLNWRTSYTQNQWKHAIEAAFLCGMMAEEMGLELKLARRAALMHDIGKALTHELDGSHAVIGADYARRLGEAELIANAIGAHHTEEPFNSAYAYLVAAADAMSGARPGARRQTEDNYVAKIADLERLSRGFQGVAEAFAVQGGREVRIFVNEDRVDDLGAVNLSTRIAEKISQEMTFPGQIRVTVIREFKAVELAG
jgi:ribonuclease Y